MNENLANGTRAAELFARIRNADSGAELSCSNAREYAILKIALLKLGRDDLGLRLLSADGQVQRRVRARRTSTSGQPVSSDSSQQQAPEPICESLSTSQLEAIQGLEKAFQSCKVQGLVFVGFSDSLVAVPRELGFGAEVLSSPAALELDLHEVYHGFEDELEDLD